MQRRCPAEEKGDMVKLFAVPYAIHERGCCQERERQRREREYVPVPYSADYWISDKRE